jgi:hypothetical protein
VGVYHAISGRKELNERTPEYGQAFESFIFQELLAYNHYQKLNLPLNFWRSVNRHEVDFCWGDVLREGAEFPFLHARMLPGAIDVGFSEYTPGFFFLPPP